MRQELESVKENSVAKTLINNKYVVSTVNMYFMPVDLLDYNYETMVFKSDANGEVHDFMDLDVARADTIEEAKANHEALCAKWEDMTEDEDKTSATL